MDIFPRDLGYTDLVRLQPTADRYEECPSHIEEPVELVWLYLHTRQFCTISHLIPYH